jgi:heme exporter protein D
MDHPWFVAAAYGISAIVIAGLILWILLDGRARQRDIAALEASGVRRRSTRDGSGKA